MATNNNRKEGFALLYGLLHLRTVVWALPHSDFFLSSFLLACMIVGALTLKTHLNPKVLRGKKMRIRETEVRVGRWKDDGRQWPHEAPGAAALLRSMMGLCVRIRVCWCVCFVHLKSCWLAFGTVFWVCYVQASAWKKYHWAAESTSVSLAYSYTLGF